MRAFGMEVAFHGAVSARRRLRRILAFRALGLDKGCGLGGYVEGLHNLSPAGEA